MLLPLTLSLAIFVPQGHGRGQHRDAPHGQPQEQSQAEESGLPPGLAKKARVPPGLAKKGGLPPGIAKRFGQRIPEHPCIAIDPRYTDRAWFLLDGRWVLKKGLEPSVRLEIKNALRLPAALPPVPLPRISASLHVVLF